MTIASFAGVPAIGPCASSSGCAANPCKGNSKSAFSLSLRTDGHGDTSVSRRSSDCEVPAAVTHQRMTSAGRA